MSSREQTPLQTKIGSFRQFRTAQPGLEKFATLIVGDDGESVAIMEEVLGSLGLDVVTCTCSKDALKHMQTKTFVLILADARICGSDGFLASPPDQGTNSVIVVTVPDDKIDSGADSTGLTDYLFKPINRDVLIAKVNLFLTLEARNRELERAYSLAYKHHIQQQLILGVIDEGVLGLNNSGGVVYANARAAEILGAAENILIGRHIGEFSGDRDWHNSPIGRVCRLHGSLDRNIEADFWRVDNEKIPVSYTCTHVGDIDDIPVGGVVVFRDMRRQNEAEVRLLRSANFDSLTGLANRTRFYEFLGSATKNTAGDSGELALLLLDVDNFKDVNGTLGPRAGDKLLVEIAGRIKGLIKHGDLLARISGDEFALLMRSEELASDTAVFAAQVTVVMAAPMSIDEQEVHTTCSIGIATLADANGSTNEMLKAAGLALKKAKAEGGNCHYFYSAKLQKHKLHRLQIERRLREFVETGRFELHFQPLVDCSTGKVAGAEALIRWPRDDDMRVGPDVFIPVAEDSGQIKAIGEWVLTTAIQALKGWLDEGLVDESFRLAINISTLQLMDEQFHNSVKKVIARFQLPPRYLEFELTESAVMYEPSRVIQNLNKLHALGITIAIDDFGTGYSSLSYLTRMPIDILKIDKCFIDGIGLITENEAVVRAVVAMGHNLELTLVAEGVEKDSQRRFLIDNKCDYLQGYLFSRPLPESEFLVYLREFEQNV